MTSSKLEGFLVLPEIKNIGLRPDSPYNFNTTGRLHAGKFQQIMDFLMNESTDRSDLEESLDGHLLQHSLLNLTNDQLADFCRHVVMANKIHLDWELVDELIATLDQKYLANWKLPNLGFIKGFKEAYSSIIKWDDQPKYKQIITDILASPELSLIKTNSVSERLESKLKIWTVKELAKLFDILIQFDVSQFEKVAMGQYIDLVKAISELFTAEIKDRKYNTYQKIALTLIYTKSYVNLGKIAVTRSQQLIDRMWREVERLSDQEITSFRYLFGAAYSIIGYHVFLSQTEFVSRRRMLGQLIDNFVMAKELPVTKWFEIVMDEEIPLTIRSYIIHGYSYIIKILKLHSAEFPAGETRDNLLDLVRQINDALQKAVLKSLNYHDVLLDEPFIKKETHQMQLKQVSPYIIEIQKVLLLTIPDQIYFGRDFDKSKVQQLVGLGNELTALFSNENDAILFKINCELGLLTYPFEEVYGEIYSEIEQTFSIILCKTFEEKIINTMSILIDFLLKSSQNTGVIAIEKYEIILCFIAEWLQYFQKSEVLFSEALMVIAPIVSICFVQIARGYFETNYIQKAFLSYLNMNHFVELIMDQINESPSWNVSKQQGEKDREDITNRFEQLISEWNFEELMNITNIKELVTNIELSLSEVSQGGGTSSLSGMLEDDVVFGYLDLTKQLEDFIKNNMESHKDETRQDDQIYEPFDPQSFHNLGRLGSSVELIGKTELHFPVIRNVHSLAAALNIFPMELSLPEAFTRETKLYETFKKIFLV